MCKTSVVAGPNCGVSIMPMLPIDGTETGGRSSEKNATSPVTFSTEGLPLKEQFDVYREFCAPVIDISPCEEPRNGFSAACDMWFLGGLVLRHIRVSGGKFARNRKQLCRDGLDHWVFNVARSGKQAVKTSAHELSIDANVPSMFSLACAYDASRTDIDWLGLFIPRGVFPEIDVAFRHDQHVILNNPTGRVLAAHLGALADELPAMTPDDMNHACEATRAIVSSCTVPSGFVPDPADVYSQLPRVRHIRGIIDQHLGSVTLRPARLCRLAGVSRSNLYRMFEPYGGVARYIQTRRLQHIHDILSDPGCTRPIISIANDYCFYDSTALSRAFRREFGYSPTDLRRSATATRTLTADHHSVIQDASAGRWNMLYRA